MINVIPTNGELLWIWRKRHKLSVVCAAKTLGVTRFAYAESEHDRWPTPTPLKTPLVPTDGELLRVLRRRSHVARDDVAARLGVCHVTYLKLERSGDKRVIDLWLSEEEADT